MKRKIILHTSFAVGFLSMILLFSGIFSFPRLSFGQTATSTVASVSPISATGGTVENVTGKIANFGTIASISFKCRSYPALVDCINSGAGPLDSSGKFSVSVTGLTPNTTYQYSVWKLVPGVPSMISGGEWSPSRTFTTASVATTTTSTTTSGGPDIISTLSASSTSPTSVSIQGLITYYGSSTSFIAKATPMIGSSVFGSLTVGRFPGFSIALTGLSPSTSYTCTITSMPDNTVIADSSVCPGFTTGAVGVGSFNATVSTSTGVLVVSGNGGAVALPNSDITIRVGTSSTAIGDITSSTTVEPDGSFTFNIGSLLNPGTTYYYSISDSATDPAFSGTTVVGAKGSFKTGGLAPGTVTVTGFAPVSNADGSAISFTAIAGSSTSPFVFSIACATSTTLRNPKIQSFNVTSGLPNISGSITLSAPVTPTLPYYCELIDSSSHLLTVYKTVTRASGQTGIPFVIEVTPYTVTIGLNFATGTYVSFPPHAYYGKTTTDSAPYVLRNDSTAPNNYTVTITGLSSSTSYVYSVINDSSSPIGGIQPGSPFGPLNQTFKTLVPPPTIPSISGTYPTVDNSKWLGKGIVRCLGGMNNGVQGCGFPELMEMIDLIIGYLLFIIAPAIVAVYLSYAGLMYITAGESAENAGKAKGMMTSVITGWILALCAWIIVKYVLQALGYDESIFPTFY
jgi:hypothetical protein